MESGFNKDKVSLRYSNFIEGKLELRLEEVNLNFGKEVVIREKTFRECHHAGLVRVTAAPVMVVPSEKNPEALKNYFPDNRIATEVICTKVVTNPLPCEGN